MLGGGGLPTAMPSCSFGGCAGSSWRGRRRRRSGKSSGLGGTGTWGKRLGSRGGGTFAPWGVLQLGAPPAEGCQGADWPVFPCDLCPLCPQQVRATSIWPTRSTTPVSGRDLRGAGLPPPGALQRPRPRGAWGRGRVGPATALPGREVCFPGSPGVPQQSLSEGRAYHSLRLSDPGRGRGLRTRWAGGFASQSLSPR